MPWRLQTRLAQILVAGEILVVFPYGDTGILPLGVRPIVSVDPTGSSELNPDLQRRVATTMIQVPPLRARREDIPGLVRYLVKDVGAASGIRQKSISDQAIDLLSALPWKGNLTELDVLIRRLVTKAPGSQIRLTDVLAHVRLDAQPATSIYGGTLREARESFERDYVAAVLDQHRGRMGEAARALGLQRTNLYRKVRRLSVKRRQGRQVS
jgi:two-component system nitrogen regulation response regulator NtrX